MPLFREGSDAWQHDKYHKVTSYVYSLADSFQRHIPVTSIEFNPPVVSSLEKQSSEYWLQLEAPDEEDLKILKSLKSKIKHMAQCRNADSFLSVTDSAAGLLRMHNLTMMRLLSDPDFTQKFLQSEPVGWEHRRTIIHLTRNHSILWLKDFLDKCRRLGFTQLLLITGDPLKQVKFPNVLAKEALAMNDEDAAGHRLKNSVELISFIRGYAPEMYIGAAHNPFMKRAVAHKHLLRKIQAGAQFLITQPVAYYDECWSVMKEYEAFCKEQGLDIPLVLGVFNYSVPVGSKGYKEETFLKRYKFWKRLFGFVPDGVRADYDSGLNGVEILARSINKLKRMGYYHFDVMNAEKQGWSVVSKGRRLAHEQDRFMGSFDN